LAPALVEYTEQENLNALKELDACAPQCETLEQMVADYAALREAIRETQQTSDYNPPPYP